MAQSFPETAHLKTDKAAFNENWDRIKWNKTEPKAASYVVIEGEVIECPITLPGKHVTDGMCGEYGIKDTSEEFKQWKEDQRKRIIAERLKKESYESEASAPSTSN